MPKSVSQPFVGSLSQSPLPGSQASTHLLAPQVWNCGHTVSQSPQCLASVVRSTSQPVPTIASQSPQPGSQVPTSHSPFVHAGCECSDMHGVLQAPQFCGLLPRSTSQPFSGAVSQSSKVPVHGPRLQVPLSQAFTALAMPHGRHSSEAQPKSGLAAETQALPQIFCPNEHAWNAPKSANSRARARR